MASSSSTVMASPDVIASSYDVFLSFRGADTRHSFTDHLYDRLKRAGICAFRDEEEINRGEELKPEIEKAIRASRASIVILSHTYATSAWCLDELVLILEQRRVFGHFVLPIFYHVAPTDVRKHKGHFAVAKDIWKTALTEVANLSGFTLSGPETKTLKKIVDTIYNWLDEKEVHLPLNITGIPSRYEEIRSWLDQYNAEFLAIYGMGGSGKTTLAKYIYNLHRRAFEYVSFVEDIGSRCKTYNDLLELQKQLLKDIVGGKKRKIPGISRGTRMIEEVLQMNKTLIVLDDIVERSQLVALLGTGKINVQSKIIITTRESTDNWFDFPYWRCQKYEMRLLNDDESLELFSRHAFRSKIQHADYKGLLTYCEGNPLAIEVLGSSMAKHNVDMIMPSQLRLMEREMDSRIQSALIRSYVLLPSNTVKELFLHIACFFIGIDVDYVIKILEPDYAARSGIKTLLEKCLLSISPNKKVMMHRLLQEMAKNIVRQESTKLPAERSRVWLSSDSYKILRTGKGSKTVEGLALDMKMLQKVDFAFKSSELKTDALQNMELLRLLQLNFAELSGSYEHVSENLRWLSWHGFHLRTIPSDLYMGNLVAIDMSYSKLEVFEPPMVLRSLQILNLKDSHNLFEIRNIFNIPYLETLILWNCYSLINVCKGVGDLTSLTLLNMTGCKSLCNREKMNLLGASTSGGVVTKQPSFSFPFSLNQLFLKDCNLECTDSLSFSVQPYLKYLNLCNGLFESLPCYNHLETLRVLDLSFCSRLKCLLSLPSTLAELYIYYCVSLEKITFQSHRFPLQELGYEGCVNLYEIEGYIKLIPIAKLDETDLGHMKWLREYENHQVRLVGDDELTVGRSWHIQMLYEFNIMSTSLPHIKDPNMTPNYTSNLPYLSFEVPWCPENKTLEGINVTFNYTISNDDWAWFCKISTTNGGIDLMYSPKVFGKPELGEICLWYGYWPIGNTLDTGDMVNVSIVEISGVEVHGCGVSLVYAEMETLENNMGWEEILGLDLSGFKLSTGAYYLCRRDFFELMEVGRLTSDWFRILVGDTIDDTEVRGWRKNGGPKQVNDESFTEIKSVRCIIHGPQLEDIYMLAEMSKSSIHDKTLAFTSSLFEGEITDEAMEEKNVKQYKSDERVGDLISTFDDITMEDSDSYLVGRTMNSTTGESEKPSSSTLAHQCRLFSLAEIQSATRNFDANLILGKGALRTVYKGVLSSEDSAHFVAVKRWDLTYDLDVQFREEIDTHCKFHHRHLLSFFGYCDDNKEKILVYKFMPKGNLFNHLQNAHTHLSWVTRLRIAIGAARGIDYLHTGLGTHSAIHGDVNSTNILLDENWEAVISDIGLSKIVPTDQSISYVSPWVVGTYGYADPEFMATGKLTLKSDVYSFGVVLFELLSGRTAFDNNYGNDIKMVEWAKKCVKKRTLDKMVDSKIKGTISAKCLRGFTQIADRCVRDVSNERPTMSEVVASLEALLELQDESSGKMGFPWNILKYFLPPTKQSSDQSGSSSQKSLEENKNRIDK